MTVPTVETFTITGWRKIQRYKDRLPRWFVLTSTLRNDLNFKAATAGIDPITDAEMGQIVGLFSLATMHDRPDEMPNGPEFPMDPEWVRQFAGLNSTPDLERLATLCVISCNKLLRILPNEGGVSVTHRTGQDRTGHKSGGQPPLLLTPQINKTENGKVEPKFTRKVLEYGDAVVREWNSHFGSNRTANETILHAVDLALKKVPSATKDDFINVVRDRITEEWVDPAKRSVDSLIRAGKFPGHVERIREQSKKKVDWIR